MIFFFLLHFAHADCVKSNAEFQSSEKLRKVYGDKYDPFTKWESSEGAEILPDGKGSMYVKVPMLGRWLGYKDSPLEFSVCEEAGKPYFMQNGKRSQFEDPAGNTLILSDGKRSAKFKRFDSKK